MLILIGDVNCGKSYFFENLLPVELKQYLSKTTSDKRTDLYQQMSNTVLIFKDEMSRMCKQEGNEFRELLAEDYMNFRGAYKEMNEQKRRISTFCGASNNMDVIPDVANNRRMIPFVFKKGGILSRNFDGISKWGWFIQSWLSEEDYELNRKEVEVLRSASTEHDTRIEVMQQIEIYLDESNEEVKGHHLNLGEVEGALKTVFKLRGWDIGKRRCYKDT